MRISVGAEGMRVSLVLPVRFGLWICIRLLKKRMPDIADFLHAERKHLCAILRQARRTHGKLELVRIESREGERIRISL